MEKIGILTCIHANTVCTGAGCLKAFNERTDFFQTYSNDTKLSVFMTCNGCKEEQILEPEEDSGMLEKIDRLLQEQINKIHVGICRIQENQQECDRIKKICNIIEAKGIEVIRGTHKE